LAKYLPKYFEINAEMLKYIRNKSYVSVRIKVKFLKDGEEQIDEYFIPHEHNRKYLAQTLSDLTKIMMEQVPIIRENIAEFLRCGSGYVFGGYKIGEIRAYAI
jgi:hypothetical protein